MSNVCSKPECCGPTTSEYETLKAENEKLKAQVEELEKEVSLINSEEMENEEEIAKLIAENDLLKAKNGELNGSKDYWFKKGYDEAEQFYKVDKEYLDEKEDEIDNMLGEIKELRDKKEELDNCFQELCDDIIKSGATWGACSHSSDLVASYVYEKIDEDDEIEKLKAQVEKLEKYNSAWNIIGSNHWDWFSESIDKTTAHRFIDLGVAQKDDFCWDLWSDDE